MTEMTRIDAQGAARAAGWTNHPINLRLSVPLPGGRFYLTIVGGRERRSAARRRSERKLHPLATLGNVLFALGAAGTMYVLAAAVTILASSIIEF